MGERSDRTPRGPEGHGNPGTGPSGRPHGEKTPIANRRCDRVNRVTGRLDPAHPPPGRAARLGHVKDDYEVAMELIREAKRSLPPPGPVVLTEEYLRWVELAEQLPENRSGSDKTWTERTLVEWSQALADLEERPRT